ncbi:MAG: AIR synthase family protein [Kiritimatiellia bacterium]
MSLNAGKIDQAALQRFLAYTGTADPQVLLGPKFGEDAGVVRVGPGGLVAASDPVTLAADRIGWYAVNINANDIAVTGGVPRWFLSTLLLPPTATGETVESIFLQIHDACRELSVAVIGGHTEVTMNVRQPLICGTMLGTVDPGRIIKTSGARAGDVVIMTRGVCIEGAALLALDRPVESKFILGEERWKKVCNYLHDPGISVVRDARIACEAADVHAMHDPTEGGLNMGLYEMAAASKLGVEVDEDSVLFMDEAVELCERFAMDPLRTLASGTLLIAAAPGEADRILAAYQRNNVRAAVIGRMVPEGFTVFRKGLRYPLVCSAKDETAGLVNRELFPES